MTSYVQLNQFQAPAARAGVSGAITDAAVRHKIEQPRKQVQFFIGGQLVLVSPSVGETTDAHWGPFVTVNDVSLFSGTKTMLVDVTVRCQVNECYRFQATPPVVLGHEYSMHHDIDQDFYTTRVISGRGIFNAARLKALGAKADDFRAYLFHPIPLGFHRQSITARVDEAGGQLQYTIVDRELSHSIAIGAAQLGVTRIECWHSSRVTKKDWYEQQIGTVQSMALYGFATGIASAIATETAASWAINKIPVKVLRDGLLKGAGLAGFALGAPVGAAYGLYQARGNVPVRTQSITCRVWGNRTTHRGNLRLVAANLMWHRLKNLSHTAGATDVAWNDHVAQDMKYVEGTATIIEPPFNSLVVASAAGIQNAWRPFWPAAPGFGPDQAFPDEGHQTENVPGILDVGILNHVGPPGGGGPFGHPAVAGAGNARGSYTEALVSSALLAPCATVARPSKTPVAVERVATPVPV